MKINVDIPNGVSGKWKVESFVVEQADVDFFNMRQMIRGGRPIEKGIYKKLMYNDIIVMSNTPTEIKDFSYFISIARGNILINGLGLGVILVTLLKKEDITSITIIEKSSDVIKLISPHFKDNRLTIINDDAFDWNPPRGTKYDYVWHDIWNNICSDNLKEMTKLHRKYSHKTKWQDSWCKAECRKQKKASW